MKIESLSPQGKFLFVLATVVSLTGQGFALAPRVFEPLLKYLSAAGSVIPTAIVLILALFLYVAALRPVTRARIQIWTFLGVQIVVILGVILLTKEIGSRAQEAGFALSSSITLLTSFGAFLAANSASPRRQFSRERKRFPIILQHGR